MAAGLTLAGNSTYTVSAAAMLRSLQTVSDAPRAAASALDNQHHHLPYVARKQRRNRTTFTMTQVCLVAMRRPHSSICENILIFGEDTEMAKRDSFGGHSVCL